jgi:hypothetical protein
MRAGLIDRLIADPWRTTWRALKIGAIGLIMVSGAWGMTCDFLHMQPERAHPNPSIESAASAYESFVFGDDCYEWFRRLRRWDTQAPIRIEVRGHDTGAFAASTLRLAAELSHLIDVPASVVSANGNVRVSLSNEGRRCDGTHRVRQGLITSVEVDASGEREDIELCMRTRVVGLVTGLSQPRGVKHNSSLTVDLLDHVFGRPGDPLWIGGILARSKSPERVPSEETRLIRAHFDARLKPGMPRREAAPIIREVLADFGVGK